MMLLLSSLLLVVGLGFYRRANTAWFFRLTHTLVTITFLFVTASYLLADYFTGNGIDESVAYHLEYGLEGAGFGEYAMLMLVSLVFVIFAIWLLYWLLKKAATQKGKNSWLGLFSITALVAALLISPGTRGWYDLYRHQLNLFKDPFSELDIDADESEIAKLPVFKKYYRTPVLKKKPEKPLNLVFIYAEGLERTYFDEERFPGLIQHLRSLEQSSAYFTDIKQVAGSGWTIAGMVASQCGIPLFTPSHGNSMSGMDTFLAGATCLGDLLKQAGYHLAFYGGADLNFAGKGKFYTTHGFDEVSGRAKLLPTLKYPHYKTAWGLFDDSLFELAFVQFDKLSRQKDPFGLFLLTLDTHSPNGHPSGSCKGMQYRDGSNPILNAVACSDFLIGRFIRQIEQSSFADNTLVVLVSDHLALRNTAHSMLKKGPRRDLFMVRGPGVESGAIAKEGSPLDITPTLLPYLGIKAEVGLGRNLLGGELPIITEFADKTNGMMRFWSPQIGRFWDFPEIRETIRVDAINHTINLDDREFPLPILIQFDPRLHTKLHFQIDNSPGHKTLVDHLRGFNRHTPYLWVDSCDVVSRYNERASGEGLCAILGRTQHKSQWVQKIPDTVVITVEDIRQLAFQRDPEG